MRSTDGALSPLAQKQEHGDMLADDVRCKDKHKIAAKVTRHLHTGNSNILGVPSAFTTKLWLRIRKEGCVTLSRVFLGHIIITTALGDTHAGGVNTGACCLLAVAADDDGEHCMPKCVRHCAVHLVVIAWRSMGGNMGPSDSGDGVLE